MRTGWMTLIILVTYTLLFNCKQDVQEAMIFENPHTEYTMEVSTVNLCD